MSNKGPRILPTLIMVAGILLGVMAIEYFSEEIDELGVINKQILFIGVGIIGTLGILFYTFKNINESSIGGNKKIMRYGRPARAKIISIGEGGAGKRDIGVMTINDQPVVRLNLEVYDGNKPPYQTSIKKIIPRLQVPQLQSGAFVAIKIDPNNPQEIEIDSEGKGLEGFEDRKNYNEAGLVQGDNEMIRKEGKDGEAEVLKVEDTGKSENMLPIVAITYQITGPNIEPYKLLSKVPMATEHIELVKSYVGQKIPAKIHPQDKNKVAIDFQPK